jgi:anti-anti-sigma regulatory factor
MLRITRVEVTPTTVHLRIEGRIVGDWVRLLEEELALCDESAQRVVLDLAGVGFANEAALAILERALARGTRLVACSPLITALLGRPLEP